MLLFYFAILLFLSLVHQVFPDCSDKITDCYRDLDKCKDPGSWGSYMADNCKKSCNLCNSVVCKDKISNCYRDVSQCNSAGSWGDYMKENCPKTCNFCSETGTGTGGGSAKCGQPSVQQSRIFNGVSAVKGAWPWIAAIYDRHNLKHICGGTLIKPNWILTAAHCVYGFQAYNLGVILGEHDRSWDDGDEQRRNVRSVITHHLYSNSNKDADIALLELEKPVRLNSKVQVICLPQHGRSSNVGKWCYLTGWGGIQHHSSNYNVLQQAQLPVVSVKHCYGKRNYICAGFGGSTQANACRGDSGGPFACQQSDGSWVQHGITSFVVELCKKYTGFLNVSHYLDWIKRYVK